MRPDIFQLVLEPRLPENILLQKRKYKKITPEADMIKKKNTVHLTSRLTGKICLGLADIINKVYQKRGYGKIS